MSTVSDRWFFCGDVNLEYGGSFIDLSTWDDGYCSAVRVTDLDSGCGFRGACLIEHVIILGTTDAKRIRDALRCVGGIDGRNRDKQSLRHQIADALLSYGYAEPDDYSGHIPHTEVVQMEADGPMVFDGWKADKRLRGTTLEDYVAAVHLS
jgi:hypothetical protein